jgi:hypothetical protein
MMKHSRKVHSKSELKLARQSHKETEKEHEFLTIKQKLSSVHQSYEQKYQKAFLKNAPMPKYKYPNLNDMLAIASTALNFKDRKVEKVQSKPKKRPSR